eukprot:TRINITY_DN10661_c0_g1_i1.p1 TRINITY_DN10661_c0_g1~~TRINITY_DN10661_c0_g1_i1.p1  ORF type:complete len:601 (+),score=137.97 TRINITY_DN10661_c0_g1_i1:45-1847(+)
MMASKGPRNPTPTSKASLHSVDYVAEGKIIVEFLKTYNDTDALSSAQSSKYLPLLQKIANRDLQLLEIPLDDVAEFDRDGRLVEHIMGNTMRYVSLFSEAVDLLLPRPTVDFESEDVFDVLMNHRIRHLAEDPVQTSNLDFPSRQFPPALTRRYEVAFLPLSKEKPVPVREVKSSLVGHLVSVRGIVTRVTDVKPMITVATYTCDQCGFEIYQEVNSKAFLPIFECTSQKCATNQTKGKVYMQTRGSRFVKYQEVKIQELAEQVPIGHIPRSMSVVLKGEMTRTCSPGDIITITGVFLPTPFTGYKSVRAGLIADTYLDAMHIQKLKKKYADYTISEDALETVNQLASDPELYGKLSRSIAPEIFGHDDVKKALLLLLVGGVTKVMPDKMKIRGDINICLMGDPGVAKSQLLKQISIISPRGVYTTGKGSSGVGLTAAVMRDSTTNDLVLEGGALVLADLGVCCIDEFDKMEESDRTAIHEVMEQQTVSIAKAGITTTLNARTSILAAANPLYGRYNPHKSPTENINLPAALLSRFDLLFLIVDQARPDADFALAKHVTYVHMHGKPPELDFTPVDSNTLRCDTKLWLWIKIVQQICVVA